MRRLIPDLFTFYTFILLLTVALNSRVSAQNNCNWTGEGPDNSWHTTENWDCDAHDGIPTVDDSVTIAPAGSVEVFLGDHVEARALSIGIDELDIDSDLHKLITTVDSVALNIGEGGMTIHQSGRIDIGQSQTPCCVGMRPGLRAFLNSEGPMIVHGGLYLSNSTINTQIVLTRPDDGGRRGRLQARGWNVIHGSVDVINGFFQVVVPGGFYGNPQPHIRLIDNNLFISDSSSVQLYVDSYPLGAPQPDEASAITVEGGIWDQRGRVTTSGNPANNIIKPLIIDAQIVNSGFITSRLARAQGFLLRGPDEAVHENTGILEIGGLLGSDTEEGAVDGFGLFIDQGRSLQNSGEIQLHRFRTAEGHVINLDGGIITDETNVTEAGNYILGFLGPQSVQVELLDPGDIDRLTMTWYGEDHPEASIDSRILGTEHWWDLQAVTADSSTASGNMSLRLPLLHPNSPQICRYQEDPAGWDCLTTLVDAGHAKVGGLNKLSQWAVADEIIDSTPLLIDDMLDPDFGDGGIITHQVQEYDRGHAPVLEQDGSVTVFGISETIGLSATRVGSITQFGNDGAVSFSQTYGSSAFGCSNTPQAYYTGMKLNNGDYLSAGYSQTTCSGIPRLFQLQLLNESGNWLKTYEQAGFYNQESIAFGLAEQADGKIIAVGRASGSGFDSSTYDAAAARYLEDGTLDPDFGTEGEVVFDIEGQEDQFLAVALQDDGKIIVAGFTETQNGRDFLLMRLNQDGTKDESFGTEGIVIYDFHGYQDQIGDIGIQSDGKIVAAGRSTDADGTTLRFTITRFLENGTIDSSFGVNGIIIVDFGATVSFATAMKIDEMDRIYVAGSTETGPGGEESREVALAVLDPDGTLSSEFSTEGLQVFGFAPESADVALGLDVDPAGKVIAVTGYTGIRINGNLHSKLAVARLIGFKDIILPGNISLITPMNNSDDVPLLATLEWDSGDGADHYHVQISTESDFSSLLVDSVLTQSSLTLSEPLEPSTLHFWRVSGMNENGKGDWSVSWNFTTGMATSTADSDELPTIYSLYQNYPNPFNPATVIRYDLPVASDVLIEVFNMIGQRVEVLVDHHQEAGTHSVNFDAEHLSSGIYLYRMTVKNNAIVNTRLFTAVRKFILIK